MKKKKLSRTLCTAIDLLASIVCGKKSIELDQALDEARHFLVATDAERARWDPIHFGQRKKQKENTGG